MASKLIFIVALTAVLLISSSNAGLSSGFKAMNDPDSDQFNDPPAPPVKKQSMQPEESQQELSDFNNSPPAQPQEEANKNTPTKKPKKSSKKAPSSAFSFFQQQSQPKSQQPFPGGFNYQAAQQLANSMQQSQPKFPASMFQQFPSGFNPMSAFAAAGASSNPWTNMMSKQQFPSSGSFQQVFSAFNGMNSQKPVSNSKPSASKMNQQKSQQASASANTDIYQNADTTDFLQNLMMANQ